MARTNYHALTDAGQEKIRNRAVNLATEVLYAQLRSAYDPSDTMNILDQMTPAIEQAAEQFMLAVDAEFHRTFYVPREG